MFDLPSQSHVEGAPPDPIPYDDGLRTVVDLKTSLTLSKDPNGSFFIQSALKSIRTQEIRSLQIRLSTTEEPIVSWALHVELDRRGVPPCLRLRLPEGSRTRQHSFLETLADLLLGCKASPWASCPIQRSSRSLHLRACKRPVAQVCACTLQIMPTEDLQAGRLAEADGPGTAAVVDDANATST